MQVRTVLQDAWAIIDHHLVYKNESAVPKALKRKLNSLSGLFETADDQFQQIREQRQAYVEKVRELVKKPKKFLETELNLDSLREYLQWRFPILPIESHGGHLSFALKPIQKGGYQILAELDKIINEDLIKKAFSALSEMDGVQKVDDKFPSSSLLACALSLVDEKLRNFLDITEQQMEIIVKYSKDTAKES